MSPVTCSKWFQLLSVKHGIWCGIVHSKQKHTDQHILNICGFWKRTAISNKLNLHLSGIFVSLSWVLLQISQALRPQSWTSSLGFQVAPPVIKHQTLCTSSAQLSNSHRNECSKTRLFTWQNRWTNLKWQNESSLMHLASVDLETPRPDNNSKTNTVKMLSRDCIEMRLCCKASQIINNNFIYLLLTKRIALNNTTQITS